MKDLDFDELDRAVSSLMSNTSSDTSQEPKEKVLTITSTVGVQDTPHGSAPAGVTPTADSQPVQVASPTSPPRPASPAARRSGRVMDIVRPASSTAPTLPHPVSREGVSIAAPVVDAPQGSQDVLAATPTEPSVSSWPDPIDFHADTAPSAPTAAPTAASTISPSQSTDQEDTLQTPFLSGTKVDKRPLGAFAAAPNVAVDTFTAPVPPVDTEQTTIEDTAQSEEQPVAAPALTVLPDELKSDIVAIESDNDTVEVERTAVTATVQPSVPPAATTATLGATSIKQQYHEEPSSTPVEHAPIYDSEPYHQPLAHPAKKKTGWLVVLLIVLLLVLGAGAGAAIYFYVL